MNIARIVLAVCMVVLGAPAVAQGESDSAETESRDYVFVFITTGEATDLTPDQQREAFGGHFSNMKRMAVAGDLLIAGPFGPPLAEPDHRGLFVFDAETIEEGMAHAETDPTYQAGVFKLTPHLLTTAAPLTKLHELDMKALEEQGENAPPGSNARSYVLASAPFDEKLYETAGEAEGVLIAARLHGSGEDESDEILLWLDAENEDAAKEITGGIDGEWTLHGWFGSKSVAAFGEGE
ncbi:MAG: YciI family protein [Phycisphaerales bacterium JB058]